MPAYKYSFVTPGYHDLTIHNDKEERLLGVLRVKPSTLLWKPNGAEKFYSISMDEFAKWIMSRESASTRVKQ